MRLRFLAKLYSLQVTLNQSAIGKLAFTQLALLLLGQLRAQTALTHREGRPFLRFQQPISLLNHQNKQMSSQTQTVSQLTLMKVTSNTLKCHVFCEVNQSLQKFDLSVDDSTSVLSIINECILLIKKSQRALGLDFEFQLCELYASRKSGKKISDLPSFSSQQKILKTGLKSFYLDFDEKTQKGKKDICSQSTRSIQSEIKMEKKQMRETKPSKQIGCFCFA